MMAPILLALSDAGVTTPQGWVGWIVQEFPRLFTQLDGFLLDVVTMVGGWTYLVLFGIVFCETGLVVTPFLPGDSLLFAAGALCALPQSPLRVEWMAPLLVSAALLGDNVNYFSGRFIGPRAFTGRSRFLNPKHLDKTHAFFEKHGGKSIVLARFIPIIRTFAPFVAGIATMRYRTFLAFSLAGALLWVGSFITAGWAFGNLPWVKSNFSQVILGIVVVSVMPIAWELWKHRFAEKNAGPSNVH